MIKNKFTKLNKEKPIIDTIKPNYVTMHNSKKKFNVGVLFLLYNIIILYII